MRAFICLLSWVVVGGGVRPAFGDVSITTRPRFQDRGQFTYLILADSRHSLEVVWGMPPKMHFVPVNLDTNRIYTFSMHEKPYRTIAIQELRRVQADGQTVYDIEVCEVHKTKMEYKEVRVAYGLPGPAEVPTDTERRLFPHCREYSLGGCVVSPDSPKTERIYVCNECKRGYEKWKAENEKNQ